MLHPVPLWSFAGFSRWCQPSVVKVCIKRHKGSNPYHPEILCDESATEKMVSINIGFKCIFISIEINVLLGRLLKCCKINMYMTDWMTTEFDIATTYEADEGVSHGRYANLCCNFISTIMILFSVYIVMLYVGFLSATGLWIVEVIVCIHS
jgi:hypothetical protein